MKDNMSLFCAGVFSAIFSSQPDPNRNPMHSTQAQHAGFLSGSGRVVRVRVGKLSKIVKNFIKICENLINVCLRIEISIYRLIKVVKIEILPKIGKNVLGSRIIIFYISV